MRQRFAYCCLLGANLILQIAIGVIAIVAPTWLPDLLNVSAPLATGWVHKWGGILIIVTVLSGWLDPRYAKRPNTIDFVSRFVMALLGLLLGGRSLWFALFDFVFAVMRAWPYARLLRAELMT